MDEVFVLALSALAIIRIKNKKKQTKRLWQKKWIERRNEGRDVISMLHGKLRLEDENSFRNFLRMDEDSFIKLLTLIKDKITRTDTCMRPAITAIRRLSVTLRHLATGNTLKDLSYSTRMPHNTLSVIIKQVLNALLESLQDQFLKAPNTINEWRNISKEYLEKWNFPNCLGSLDGKHISFRPLRSSGSFYRNYKGTDSIVLLALVSANYKFLLVDIGVNGRISDGGVYSRSLISKSIEENKLNFPPAEALPGRNNAIPHVIVADDAFPLKDYIMKPFRWRGLSYEQQIYNYRLSRARRTVEIAFGILSNRFRIFLQPMNLQVEKVVLITKVACMLHNFLVKSCANYITDDEVAEISQLENISQQGGNRVGEKAQKIRQEFIEYFNSNGRVSWQDDTVRRAIE